MRKNKQEIGKYEGFSFIEGMLAAFIVTVGMIAVIQLMTANLLSSFNSRNEVMASFLAQEGVEIVRNIRDNNWANGLGSFHSSTFPASASSDCRVDMNTNDFHSCIAASSKRLQIDSTSGRYTHAAGGSNSRFQRKIIISYPGNSAVVTSVVVWGAAFPIGAITASNCNQVKQCAFTSVTLSKWGE